MLIRNTAVRGVLIAVVGIIVAVLVLSIGLNDAPTDEEVSPTTTTLAATTTQPAPSTTAAPPPVLAPNNITVVVANGSGLSGAAGNVTTKLNALNYVTLGATNATNDEPASRIYYNLGFEAEAQQLAVNLEADASIVVRMPVPAPPVQSSENIAEEVDILVILGGPDDFANANAPAG